MTFAAALLATEPAVAEPHALHAHERDFRETNCYVDMIVELVHALGLEPFACLGFPLASDFEGDQWTFVKPATSDLEHLYGLRIEELCIWRPLAEHVLEQLGRGCIPLVEVDAWFLPDAKGSDYHERHAKTSIAITWLDLQARRMRYLHNAGSFVVEGADLEGVLGLGSHAPLLPPYCELVKLDRCVRLDEAELRARSLELARRWFRRRPHQNPFASWADRFPVHVEWIRAGAFPTYHAYSFATVRQAGAAFELLGSHATWLDAARGGPLARAARACASISTTAKMLILRLARVAGGGRPFDGKESFATMIGAWDQAMLAFGESLS